MFVTAVYGVLDLESGKFTFANAGHNPPLWRQGEKGIITKLNRTGAALGIIEDLPMENRTIHLNPEDFLLLYTDGLTEAFAANGEAYGEDRLLRVFSKSGSNDARKVLEIGKIVRKFWVRSAADDMTMLRSSERRNYHNRIEIIRGITLL
jgi:serine phosphatase RsbU (regulator of sigma subunit)